MVDLIQSYVPLEQCLVLLEMTGHYHKALAQYLLDWEISVYLVHVLERAKEMMKTDKRDALGLANHLYNMLEKGIQVPDKTQLARRAFPPTDTAAMLKGIIRHRYELSHEVTQRKNKFIAICDELFPECTQVFKDSNGLSALVFQEKFPTPQALATASMTTLCNARIACYPSDTNLAVFQHLASQSIGTHHPDGNAVSCWNKHNSLQNSDSCNVISSSLIKRLLTSLKVRARAKFLPPSLQLVRSKQL